MKYIKPILAVLAVFLTVQCGTCSPLKLSKFDKIVKSSPLSKSSTVSVMIKDANTGKTIYSRDEKKLLHPASTQKLFTAMASLDTLGYDYEFKTRIYKDKADNLYIKLGADPFFTSLDLKNLIRSLPSKNFKSVYIDDSIIDDIGWGLGWMSDDNTSPLIPKFSPYNIDRNIVKIKITPNIPHGTSIEFDPAASMSVINLTKIGQTQDVKVIRNNFQSPDIIYLEGNVLNPVEILVPVNSPKRYFTWRLNEFLNTYNIKRINGYSSKAVPLDAVLLSEVSHPINLIIRETLKSSDNLASESLFKVAGGYYGKTKGSNILSEAMFLEFCVKNGFPTDGMVIVDASGISRNNLFSTEWMTNSLVKFYKSGKFEYLAKVLATPFEGTMRGRLPDLLGEVWVKTGTLSNISAITGYVNGQQKNKYAFTIIIQNFVADKDAAKRLEDSIILEISKLN